MLRSDRLLQPPPEINDDEDRNISYDGEKVAEVAWSNFAKIIETHKFDDGNGRTGMVALYSTFWQNHLQLKLEPLDIYVLTWYRGEADHTKWEQRVKPILVKNAEVIDGSRYLESNHFDETLKKIIELEQLIKRSHREIPGGPAKTELAEVYKAWNEKVPQSPTSTETPKESGEYEDWYK